MKRKTQSSGHFDMLIFSEPVYKSALTTFHIFHEFHKVVRIHASFTECLFKCCTWIHWIFPPSHCTPHVPHPA